MTAWMLFETRGMPQCSSICSMIRSLTYRICILTAMRYSAKGEGLHRLGITCYSYMPLSFVTLSPQDAQLLIDTQKQKVEHLINTESLPPGLKEQYDIQLQKLVAGKGADCEIMCFPGCLSGYGTYLFHNYRMVQFLHLYST